jgi:hypothetical protein
MMNHFALCLVALWFSTASLACECSKRGSKNFLSNLHQFDVIVSGTFHTDDKLKQTLTIEKIYKGVVITEVINLTSSSAGCVTNFIFKEDERLILGLTKEGDQAGQIFGVMGCTTSVLYLNGEQVKSGNRMQSYPGAKLNRIGRFSTVITLARLEKRLGRRLHNRAG